VDVAKVSEFNVLFLGSGRIAELCLRLLCKLQYINVVGVVTNADFYNGARDDLFDTPPEFISNLDRNLELILDVISRRNVNVLISVQHNWILTQDVLDAVNGQAYNLHNGRLPDYRGHHTIAHALVNNETEFTSTIHCMQDVVDVGDIVVEKTTPIWSHDTAWTLYNRVVPTAVDAFREFIEHLIDGYMPRRAIVGKGTYYSKRDLDSLRRIVTSNDCNIIRAMYFPPYEPAINQAHYLIPDGSDQNWRNTPPANLSCWEITKGTYHL
jgi:methionyl-tRNA formyltransferase